MNYNGVNIHFCWLPFGQGLTINSKRILVKPVYFKGTEKISIDVTADVIAHELNHVEKIKRLGWIKWFFTTLWRYITKGYSNTEWEIEADKVESTEDMRLGIIYHCINNNLDFA